MNLLENIGESARKASRILAKMNSVQKDSTLNAVADAIVSKQEYLISENQKDLDIAEKNGMAPALLDRLKLTQARINSMAEGLYQLVKLEDPVGEVTSMKKRPNGLMIGTQRVPLGVIGIIYEARPNVTADAFGLCFKSGNATILKGGSSALHSNNAITTVIRETLKKNQIDENCIQLITETSHEVVEEMMHMNKYIDVLIPRGGAGLIKTVVEKSTIPVIETGTGNCHIYVDESADFDMAVNIINNAKTQRIGVCNACESLVVHSKVANQVIPRIVDKLKESGVEVRGDERAQQADARIIAATQEDWGKEYLDYIISIRVVDNIDEAIAHINQYNTGHSESIITKDYTASQQFLSEIDAAAVYVNASTRFTDGFEFGFGAEIGISTQKLHARGPMGLKELTTSKYIIYGNGQVRP